MQRRQQVLVQVVYLKQHKNELCKKSVSYLQLWTEKKTSLRTHLHS
jgi:hypothetical protein